MSRQKGHPTILDTKILLNKKLETVIIKIKKR